MNGTRTRVIVKILLAEQAMMADGKTMIGREEDPGIVRQAAAIELIEDAADLGIEMRDQMHSIRVDGPLPRARCAGRGRASRRASRVRSR